MTDTRQKSSKKSLTAQQRKAAARPTHLMNWGESLNVREDAARQLGHLGGVARGTHWNY